jgi:hypothetical protein
MSRLSLWLAGATAVLLISVRAAVGASDTAPATAPTALSAEQWGHCDIVLQGPSTGNPYTDVTLSANFHLGSTSLDLPGFYDGDAVYRVRFMPTEPGTWTYQTHSNVPDLDGKTGEVLCTKPSAGNHGLVRVANHFHFAYADGTPYVEMGTTAYDWTNQPDAREAETLATLKTSPFNKIRMCVLPTRYLPPDEVPARLPFDGTLPKAWDFTHFNPVFFQNVEKCVGQLQDLGIEADVILLHPYGKVLGFAAMPAEVDDRYIRYVVARLAGYRNVWWSMANEYDMMHAKKTADWDRIFQLVMKLDPYGHLRGIQQSRVIYNQPWMTHASIQNPRAVSAFDRTDKIRSLYDKPIIFDEIQYEGNIKVNWGRLPAADMVSRFWTATVGGTYAGHGETYEDSPWSNSGGKLIGQSPPRLAFLRKILEAGPPEGIDPIANSQDTRVAGKAGEYYLLYLGHDNPVEWRFTLPSAGLPEGSLMHVEIIDTWDMTITPVAQAFKTVALDEKTCVAENKGTVNLPGKPFIALRITRVGGS